MLGTVLGCVLLLMSLAHSTALASIPPDFSQYALRSQSPILRLRSGQVSSLQSPISNPHPLTLTLRVIPSPIAQGQTSVILARTNAEVAISGRLSDQSLVFAGSGRNHWALVGVPPWGETGLHWLTVVATDALGREATRTTLVPVVATGFIEEGVTLLSGREELLDPDIIAGEWGALERVFRVVTPRQLWSSSFRLPVRSVVTSEFGARRSFGGGPPQGYHSGVDLRGKEGTPVVAAERGRVVLAEELTLRGRAVILDHGLGVHTAYYHLAAITVELGQLVYKGQIIGQVGMTGLVSGPHLHWELRIQEVPVDPLAWTMTTIPAPERSRPQLLPYDR